MRAFKDTKFGDLTGQIYSKSINLNNANITSLEGCPKDVKGNFEVSNNRLETLKHAPKEVLNDFYCNDNVLTSLEGAPEFVGGDFNCFGNQLTTLKGIKPVDPTDEFAWNVFGTFNCSENPHLKNQKEQIIKFQVKADSYITDDDGLFKFEDIKEEFIAYKMKTKVQSKGFRTLLGINK